MQKLILTGIVLIAAFAVKAQNSNTINPDNAGSIMSPHIVGKKTLQVEGGYTFRSYTSEKEALKLQGSDFPNQAYKSISNSGQISLRYGLFSRFEVSAGYSGNKFNSELYQDKELIRNGDYFGNAYHIRLKGNILKGEGVSPSLGVAVTYGSAPFRTEYYAVNIAAGSQFGEKVGLKVNLGYMASNNYNFDVHVDYAASEKVLIFAEYFNNLVQSNIADIDPVLFTNLSAGMGYRLSPNTQFNIFGTYYLPQPRFHREGSVNSEYSLNLSFASRIDW